MEAIGIRRYPTTRRRRPTRQFSGLAIDWTSHGLSIDIKSYYREPVSTLCPGSFDSVDSNRPIDLGTDEHTRDLVGPILLSLKSTGPTFSVARSSRSISPGFSL